MSRYTVGRMTFPGVERDVCNLSRYNDPNDAQRVADILNEIVAGPWCAFDVETGRVWEP